MEKVFVSSQDLLCPNIRKKMTKIQGLIFSCRLKPAVGEKYEVLFCDESHIVDLKNRKNPDTFVDAFFQITNVLETYKHALTPMDDRNEWPESNKPFVLPPEHVKLPGRPPKNRKKDQHEEPKQGQKKLSLKGIMKMTYSKYGKFDHNKRSWKRGRPRKNVEQEIPRFSTAQTRQKCTTENVRVQERRPADKDME
ncbi:hypothetical protein C2S51_015796 [Perilla frutescens var. frutescens]|nr:hypothetical protein C2S51_015796 [Perilla frutescens var. frutescens]